ncbi:MAG: hypothetical protein MPEBLZ_04085 [Candidatus Methanoperedens nitroreducens]|uniref:Uncharacterized protein n=1 Tax=Candidatus Methanoperedens nitratireducens TaxID=1392998 RepID=A0A0P8A0B7_9EURY|nr:hypothetical protein [Candidatus Methanoperedens sp. BLZ2]KAB2945525.1 MAG: hypothetical protein F9K14_10880 [Candidatus Methanoperedens sp.]KPQ41376.1 MAG: hypothetical protein MPEBLZ_04085 [Candidatus Methanoperedens sp. BLZ1]MBZ0174776.1 hypothetical protein [Candidatus Methanoperedens nitroreducens]MCX9080121.1 hypothetical protein [Candidatus Methanoperedens sp.]
MSRSNKTGRFAFFIRNDRAWADFFITRIGLILFAAILLLAAFKIYPMFQERESRLDLDTIASDITSKIEAIDSITIPGYKYNYVFEENNRDMRIEISTEYITVHSNLSSPIWGDRELIHAEPVITHVYPPNSIWSNTSGFRKYVSDAIGGGRNGDVSSPLDIEVDKQKVDTIFESTRKELAVSPFIPDLNKPLFIEKVIIHYKNQTEIQKRDYVFVYQ